MSRPSGRRALITAAAIAVLAASCSGPKYQYVRNTPLRSAFKVPSDWTIFDKQTLLGEPSGPQPSTPDPIRWLVGLDGSPQPSVTHVLDPRTLDTDFPQGVAIVQRYSFNDRDRSSFQSLRNYLFPVDTLLQDPNNAQVLSYDDHIDRNGVRGVHLVFQFRSSALASAVASSSTSTTQTGTSNLQRTLLGGSGAALLNPSYVTVDQTVFVNSATSQIYFIAVLCSAACYDRNRGAIETIVNSWTVLP